MLKIGVITMALLSFLNANWFTDFFDDTPKTYYMVPIDLSSDKNEVKFILRSVDGEKGGYFSLYFVVPKSSSKDYALLHDFIFGGKKREGTSIPVRLTIYRIGQNNSLTLFYDKTIESKGWSGTGGDINGKQVTYWQRTIDVLRLPKGKYSIQLTNLKDFFELKGIEVYFAVHGGRGKY
jgi:hypothetical protein